MIQYNAWIIVSLQQTGLAPHVQSMNTSWLHLMRSSWYPIWGGKTASIIRACAFPPSFLRRSGPHLSKSILDDCAFVKVRELTAARFVWLCMRHSKPLRQRDCAFIHPSPSRHSLFSTLSASFTREVRIRNADSSKNNQPIKNLSLVNMD